MVAACSGIDPGAIEVPVLDVPPATQESLSLARLRISLQLLSPDASARNVAARDLLAGPGTPDDPPPSPPDDGPPTPPATGRDAAPD